MSPLSSVLMICSNNFGGLISCLRVHMPQIFVYFPPSNGGDIVLAGKKVVGYGGFG